jgi:pyruvate formate lyase activating enzyme
VKTARFWSPEAQGPAGASGLRCQLCPHQCLIAEGKSGICQQRLNNGGQLTLPAYARITTVALDPIEKKPLYHFMPGSAVLSLGTSGCNLRCPFCQNWSISQDQAPTEELLPKAAVGLALRKKADGIAYTYNEPTVWLEYVIDTAGLAREAGLANIMVTNGYINPQPLAEALPLIDAMNIDIKSFDDNFYADLCKGHLQPVLTTAIQAVKSGTHVEITCLLIPGHNDRAELVGEMAAWIAAELGPHTSLHLSAHFPRYRLKAPATPVQTLLTARAAALEHLDHVYLGNVSITEGANTECKSCSTTLVARQGYDTEVTELAADGRCENCGNPGPVIMRPSWKGKAGDKNVS